MSQFFRRCAIPIRLFVVVLIFAALFRTIDLHEIAKAYASANPTFLSIAVILMIPNILLQIFKWHFIIRTLQPKPTLVDATVSVFGGFFLGAATPGRTGEFARGAYLKKRSLVQMASLTILDKGFNQAIVIVVGIVSIACIVPLHLTIPLLIADVAIMGVLVNIHRLKPWIERILHRWIHSAHVENALAAFDAFSTGTVAGMAIYSVAFYIVYVGQYYIMLLAFLDLPFLTALKTLPIVYLVNFLFPVTIGDFGVKEMAAVYILKQYGAPGEAILGATLLNTVMTFFLPGAIGGVLTLIHRSSSDREVRASDGRTVQP